MIGGRNEQRAVRDRDGIGTQPMVRALWVSLALTVAAELELSDLEASARGIEAKPDQVPGALSEGR